MKLPISYKINAYLGKQREENLGNLKGKKTVDFSLSNRWTTCAQNICSTTIFPISAHCTAFASQIEKLILNAFRGFVFTFTLFRHWGKKLLLFCIIIWNRDTSDNQILGLGCLNLSAKNLAKNERKSYSSTFKAL